MRVRVRDQRLGSDQNTESECLWCEVSVSWFSETEWTDRQYDGVEDTDLLYQQQGHEALQKALDITQNADGWRTEITQVTVIYLSFLHYIL